MSDIGIQAYSPSSNFELKQFLGQPNILGINSITADKNWFQLELCEVTTVTDSSFLVCFSA